MMNIKVNANFDIIIDNLTNNVNKVTHDINQLERLCGQVTINADKLKDFVKALKCLLDTLNNIGDDGDPLVTAFNDIED